MRSFIVAQHILEFAHGARPEAFLVEAVHHCLDLSPVVYQHEHHEQRHADGVHEHANAGVRDPPLSSATVVARQVQLLVEIFAIIERCARERLKNRDGHRRQDMELRANRAEGLEKKELPKN